ncbi:hypothetical protein ID866_384 [Astraeus odoratus]|nr:hypothetical protein ID866_384 [Astraeus odoratus]
MIALKETQERTRKRIKEDIKESSNAYTDYADNVLPKLKRTYLRKCQEVEDHRAAAAAAPPPNMQNTPYAEQGGTTHTNSQSNPNLPVKSAVTAPQPLRPLDRRPSGGTSSHRTRSPSTSGAFSDFAQHGNQAVSSS